MPGPLPNENRQRRNAPTIPTTNLPAKGRGGRPPTSPIELGVAGSAWWRWAWKTPQAAAWSDGDLYFVAHRAALEDDVRALDQADFDVAELLDVEPSDVTKQVTAIVRRMKVLAVGKGALTKAMADMDDRLGLTPKGMAALRWKIVADEPAKSEPAVRAVPSRPAEDPRKLLAG